MHLRQLPPLDATAFFLDFDGTLVEIADHPDETLVDASMVSALGHLSAATQGALAIVTGREIAAIDRLLAPLHLPVAGIHGLTRRSGDGRMHLPPDMTTFLNSAAAELAQFTAANPGLFFERKTASVALHYRARPELEPQCHSLMLDIVATCTEIEFKRGKMVIEAKPGYADKGTAINDFMAEMPFAGRTPVFVGDDISDEDGFRVVNACNGMSIKIGPGATVAQYWLESAMHFARWLAEVIAQDERAS